MKSVNAILTDIEGTTSSISFVHEVLFPYAKANLKNFIVTNYDKPEVKALVIETLETVGIVTLSQEQIIRQATKVLSGWIEEDKKFKVLKELQGLIWEAGYKEQAFQGHIYKDAYLKLKQWQEKGFKLYVYSSGSVKAQKLLFGHTEYGDLNNLFSGNFDTSIGAKRDFESYQKIAKIIETPVAEILFLSDNNEELIAAQEAGMKVIKVARPEDSIAVDPLYLSVSSFAEIEI